MGLISKFLDNVHEEHVQDELSKVNKLYTGWIKLTDNCTDTKEVLQVLNAALAVSEVIKEKYTSPDKFYNQFVTNTDDVVAVYYCKRTNTIKSL
ncbi:hypothetical protein [Shewanella sp. SG41-3]|uniref:hypothetical protein n=1 Tax=Shewanella sp. SG41-3 TaxID=2760977 RepID=UPI001601DFCA|nr:hypothetical protein [Shewanella sp. SG41-3]MBB1475920.1 hypothetical protein [Shewanella sp. SG41-3]